MISSACRTSASICLPVCIAKTPFSFSSRSQALGAPKGFMLPVQRLILNAGAGLPSS